MENDRDKIVNKLANKIMFMLQNFQWNKTKENIN
jgi:hypothetical protein